MFVVTLLRSRPGYDHALPLDEQSDWNEHAVFMDGLADDGFILLGGPLANEVPVAHAVEAASEDEVRETLGRDSRSGSHLEIASTEPWTIRLDGGGANGDGRPGG